MRDAAVRVEDVGRVETARAIRARLDTVRETWQRLITEQARHGEALPGFVLDAALTALAEFVENPDPTVAAGLGRFWQQHITHSRDMVAVTAVATGLLGEALKTGLVGPDGTPDAICRECLAALLPDFSGGFVRALFVPPSMPSGEAHWYEVSQQLAEDRERRITQLGILNEVSAALTSTLSLDELYRIVYTQCGRLVDTTNFYIGTLGPGPDEMTLGLVYINGVRDPRYERTPIRMGLSRLVVERDTPIVVPDYFAACAERGIPINGVVPYAPNLAWLAAPIVANDRTIGIIAIMSDAGMFEPDEVDTIAAVARQAGAAMQNARLYEARTIQANQLKAINQLARAIATIREPESLLHAATRLIHDLFGYTSVGVFVADTDRRRLVLASQAGDDDWHELLGLTLEIGGPGIVSHAATTRACYLANDVREDPRYLAVPEIPTTRAEIAVPLLRDGVLLGVLDIQATQVNAFSERDVEVIETLADQLAIGLENAELFLRESRRRAELALMLRVSQAANSTLMLDQVLQHVAEGLCDAVEQPTCVIYLYDEEGDRLIPSAWVAREGSKLDTTRVSGFIPSAEASALLDHVLTPEGEASVIDIDCCEVGRELADLLATRSTLAVPFVVKHQVLGLALLASHDATSHFTRAQERLAAGVAAAAALALENARLYARSHTLGVAEERIRIAREIHDGMAQGLTAITLQLEAADQLFANKPEKARAKIARALELTRQNLEDARRSVLDLRASALQELTLTEALERRMLQFNAEHRDRGLTGTFHGGGMHGRLSSRVELSLYRIYEEALDNVARHAQATRVEASLTREGDTVILTVCDNGCGFDPREALAGRRSASGFGLVAIRERIRLLHGTFSVESGGPHGGGATLQVRVPFEPHHEGRAERPARQYHPREGLGHGAIDAISAVGAGGESG